MNNYELKSKVRQFKSLKINKEHRLENPRVPGSSPGSGTIFLLKFKRLQASLHLF
ncbi:hypothetical protein MTBPR1_30007 [Candidatus Terasakiella magnetica]|uniref:Uncharacterized protein n=1 Tax=Candidatus Terasakiella magnetica TaxID=1867952 RepID=A0A1C3RH61_9PROT|nr:hypothetical protein MTBPR1_30007 [Candidatus Terasakiella magnetica]